MPIREYICDKCLASEEFLFRATEEQPDEYDCSCGGKMKRSVSMSSFALKGSGWGDTGYSKVKSSGDK